MLNCVCTFCDEFSGNSQAYFYQLANSLNYSYNDRIIASTDNFIALGGLGALTESYVLILPRVHFLAIGGLPESLVPEYLDFKDQVWFAMQKGFGSVVSFEHGPANPENRAGCCVDHAHLHLMAPCSVNFHEIVARYFNLLVVDDWKKLQFLHQTGIPYIYFQDNQRNEFAAVTPKQLPSQFLRQLVASALNVPEWDWRQNPKIEMVESTYKHFQDYPINNSVNV